VPLPPAAAAELTEAELDQVAGAGECKTPDQLAKEIGSGIGGVHS
jgi:hypothetical protein